MRLIALSLAALLAVPACKPDAPRPRYGVVMGEIGRRFEASGRAAAAGRWELAAFQIDELAEALEDLERAAPPKEGDPAALPGLTKAFEQTNVVELRKAAGAKDRAAFAAAFERAAVACNACHAASAHGFIEIAPTLGKPVPVVDPLPASP